MGTNMLNVQKNNYRDVAAVITAMTDGEQPFLFETVKAVLSDPCIGQVVLCVEAKNGWLETTINSFKTDPRLHIVRLSMMPLGAVRNQALNHVQKPWVAYCDGDDVWCKGKTLIQRVFASKTGCDFVGADHYLTDEKGKIRAFALSHHLPMPSSWIVRTETMRKYPFNEALHQGQDGEWWIRTANVIQKARCPQMLLRYRVRPHSNSSSTPSKQRKERIITLARIPVIGLSILFFTYCAWFFKRQRQYIWSSDWGRPPYSH
jgi:glycosyltransferase involved in cell wall biosynthesis